jgi:glycosyltransferase involved in cell wall biosynthesis
MNEKKIKVLTISDHILSPSGVGHMARNMIFALLKTGKFQVIALGGAIKHDNYQPQRLTEFKDDLVIVPVDGYSNPDQIRSVIKMEKPDILWIITDPRFFTWLWNMENEIRPYIPIVYYHVWDNYPYPYFNKPYYDSNDMIVTISKLTDDIVKTVSPTVERIYLPHAVDVNVFKRYSDSEVEEFKKNSNFKDSPISILNKTIFFWNNRNARRKQSGTLIWWFKDFLDIVGHDKAVLLMHTDTKDQHGQDLDAIVEHLNLLQGQVLFSRQKLPVEMLARVYNMADCTVNIADAEGFGLSSLESLACETPVINTMTGGLQEQVTNGNDWFGIGIKPASQSVIGSLEVPWIYEDRISKEDFINALLKIFNMTKDQRRKMGQAGRDHVIKNYNYETYCNKWVEIMFHVYEKYGSWDSRREYKSWEIKKI